ncbi:TadE-like protein [Singulisphaera sp. GP187]|uniref:TadE/TadG family type IV pilus assembly protein n=1 Tax=Singulisphaera sp. GP187 TaxID=1882752 RepID=UPI000927B320|nr:TadE/TadG family type IV pilus assembly protein [Singulisphaera sp. GP187]SIO31575.1 TadE-like protein [Singulisphaera sp. GP187]
MIKRSSWPTRRRGAVLVEAAIILPIFLMILIGIFEYSRFVMVRNLVDNAAREGARYAIVHAYDKTTADVQAYVLKKLAGQEGQLSAGSPTIQVFKANPTTGANLDLWTNARFGDSVMVQITGTYRPAAPRLLLMNSTIQVKAQAMMRCEAN